MRILPLPSRSSAALLALASLFSGCGGRIDVHSAGSAAAPSGEQPAVRPEAPAAFTLTPTADRRLQFGWQPAARASEYRLLEARGGAAGDALLATLPASATQHDLAVLLPTRLHTRYRLQACNSAGCSEATPVALPDSLAQAVDYLKASNTGVQDNFGHTLALSGDGQTLAVAARREAGAGDARPNSGAVYVFTRSGGSWRQEAYLKAANADWNDEFGDAIALSADGLTLAVGATEEDSAATGIDGDQADNSRSGSGAVYVFARSGGAWPQQAYLKASNADRFDSFGGALALSADGRTLAVGAVGEDSAATGVDGDQADNSRPVSGAVYVFTQGDTGWRQQAYLKSSNADPGDQFGIALAMSADGATLAVSALSEDSAATGIDGNQADNSSFGSGAAYVFTRSGATWQQQAYLKASNAESNDLFGRAMVLSADGRRLAVSATSEQSAASGVNGAQSDNSAPYSGAVYLFVRQNSGWQQEAYVKASNTGAGDEFGTRLALSADGRLLAVSALFESSAATGVDGHQGNNSSLNSGAVYLFERDQAGWGQKTYLKAPNSEAGDQYGYALALSADGHVLAVGARGESSAATGVNGNATDNSAQESGAAYLY